MNRIQIKRLETHGDFRACQHIQEVVWGGAGVSAELMSVTQKFGGAVIGALVNERVVGFIYAFLARRNGRLIHWSHLMAVEPKFRDLGLGFRMKLAHRKLAMSQNLASICWTFDPLQSRNAALNIGRLGARAEDYIPNCYDRFPSAIEKGLESDRFVVNWRIRSAVVERRLLTKPAFGPAQIAALKAPRINRATMNPRGFLENHSIALNLRAPMLLAEIPTDTDRMRLAALPLARRWRIEARKIFARYFARRYRVVDFIPPGAASGGSCFYVLRRRGA